MAARITVRILPSSTTTRVLVTDHIDEVLKARLPSPSQMHRLATKTMLEAIALLYQYALHRPPFSTACES